LIALNLDVNTPYIAKKACHVERRTLPVDKHWLNNLGFL
jgi:hypothetical protein